MRAKPSRRQRAQRVHQAHPIIVERLALVGHGGERGGARFFSPYERDAAARAAARAVERELLARDLDVALERRDAVERKADPSVNFSAAAGRAELGAQMRGVAHDLYGRRLARAVEAHVERDGLAAEPARESHSLRK